MTTDQATDDQVWAKLASVKAAGAEFNSENESRTFSRCLEGTRAQLLDTLCTSMERGDRKLLWLFGEAGSGKSSVAYTVADRLRRKDHLAATFFFSLKHTDLNDTSLIYITLAYQIGKRNLILDAADEGGPRIKPTVLALAELLRDPTIPISHILITSRPYAPLVTISQGQSLVDLVSPIHIEDYRATLDVQKFLQKSFDEIYDLRNLHVLRNKPWPSQPVLSSLSQRIQGRFIVAATVARLVGGAERPDDRLNLISNMYAGGVGAMAFNLDSIDSVYRFILSDCEPADRRSGVECLSDIIALRVLLSTSTVCSLFGVDIRQHTNHLSAIIHVPPMAPNNESKVTTYHASLRDYLWDDSRSLELHVTPRSSHSRLLVKCFRLGLQQRRNREVGRVIGIGRTTSLERSQMMKSERSSLDF
ncbi:hypothetical protein CONPUDRAFT_160858 [Coniophora puteana RWD-64-598 SS2]|uniref:Nephrocystin 3-like N-terminal domain-containing protein n=1 Tax=Coniophora puteana (strain RWD-64-598) TaxID=741705 RepID=A0A5M3N4V0_CONPW|nr:uncharacterized protein CONPUDRAFT_160858 [Coniophora puteana RWD-64-598 SS2]EIW85941.1 hypothetical protein CONPUDRAFT_160858 [Coniophora puteana RWD-64-598 SS2]